jgi:uncharacterized protein YjbI with pentapeptide repeats
MRLDLRGAFISDADMSGCTLERASLITAFMMRTVLRGAVLTNSRAISCQFDGADLRAAKLDGADLNGASLIGAVYDSETVWPSGFDPVAAGAVLAPPATPES